MEAIFIFVMSLLPLQLLGAGVYSLSQRRGVCGATVFGLLTPAIMFGLTLGAWVFWEINYVNPTGDEALTITVIAFILLPLGMAANFICSLIVFLVRRNATRLPALKPLQLN